MWHWHKFAFREIIVGAFEAWCCAGDLWKMCILHLHRNHELKLTSDDLRWMIVEPVGEESDRLTTCMDEKVKLITRANL